MEFAAREQSRVFRELERALPVDDLMGWLIRTLPLANRDHLSAESHLRSRIRDRPSEPNSATL